MQFCKQDFPISVHERAWISQHLPSNSPNEQVPDPAVFYPWVHPTLPKVRITSICPASMSGRLTRSMGEDIKIELGFYSQPLVSCLVSICIPEEYDKWRIFSGRGLDSSSFKPFIKHFFTKYPVKTAKAMSNGWIEKMGRKYDRISNGVVCWHETAMNLWTKGLIEHRTVSMDTFERSEMFLVRQQKIERLVSMY